ncbi:adenylate/guanylate cyclase [Streptomyces bottropensis]|jgi:hypothetical protein|uniref:Adenylate/guanylate cyclase n=1 Tax=Streptomyces bottropensis TaxID=42235 RepID=A0ABU8APK5_9ACTN
MPAYLAQPEHSHLLLADVEGFGSRSDREQLDTREGLYGELRAAFTDELWGSCAHEDRGDAVLVVMRHAWLAHALFTDVLPRLEHGLGQRRRTDPLLRLRLSVHAGPVHTDDHGFAGNAVNLVFRLNEGRVLRQALGEARSDTALLVSDTVHETGVRAGLPGVDPTRFHSVPVSVKETQGRAWLHVAGDPECARRVAEEAQPRAADGAEPRGVSMRAGGDIRLDGSVISGGDTTVTMAPPPRWGGGRR